MNAGDVEMRVGVGLDTFFFSEIVAATVEMMNVELMT